MTGPTLERVLKFWFQDLGPQDWWNGSADLDEKIKLEFGDLVVQALRGELYKSRISPQARLAEIICLDQFTRNIYRGTARAFSGDAIALILSQEAIAGRHDLDLATDQRSFLYMPLMHSESLRIHSLAEKKMAELHIDNLSQSLTDHTAVIREFGRYPSRNKALGRESTPEELEYLKQGRSWGQ